MKSYGVSRASQRWFLVFALDTCCSRSLCGQIMAPLANEANRKSSASTTKIAPKSTWHRCTPRVLNTLGKPQCVWTSLVARLLIQQGILFSCESLVRGDAICACRLTDTVTVAVFCSFLCFLLSPVLLFSRSVCLDKQWSYRVQLEAFFNMTCRMQMILQRIVYCHEGTRPQMHVFQAPRANSKSFCHEMD